MEEFITDPKWLVLGLLSLVMALLSWIMTRQIRRLDTVEQHHVTRAALDSTITSMRTERREMHVENKEGMQSLGIKVDSLVDRVSAPLAVLQQRVDTLDERVQELKDFKHHHCEPAVRYVNFLREERDRGK